MNKYVIITDSSCDLPQSKYDAHGIDYVPLTVNLDGTDYINYADWREIEPKAFYDELRAAKPAKTTAANTDQFKAVMTPHLEAGEDILYVGFTTGLSGTFNAGRLAADELMEQYPGRKIICVDTLCASLGQGLIVDMAAEKKASGATIEECAKYVVDNKMSVAHWFTVDDLFYLHRGGRVSKTTAIVGSALGIKPVMHVDDEGKLVKVDVARGRKNSIKRLLDRMRASQISLDRVYISHGDCQEEAEMLMDMVTKEFEVKETLINHIGPVIGAHSGPGTMALFFLAKER